MPEKYMLGLLFGALSVVAVYSRFLLFLDVLDSRGFPCSSR